jgi:Ca-activated chloride channel family protein
MLGRLLRVVSSLLWALLVLPGVPSAHAQGADAEKTLAPYFVVEGAETNVESLPLASTRVALAVSDVIADVSVTQVYENRGNRPINARYVFPASTRAAVHGLSMRIRDQVIEAQIKERGQAQKTFEQAKRAGKSASLLEQERPTVFTMSVANVMPGDRIEVTLRYSELIVPTEGTYEVAFPTVVGPRYSNQVASTAPATDGFVESPYLKAGKAPNASFELSGTLAAAIPIASLVSPSHRLKTDEDNPKLTRFQLEPSEASGMNRDFILRYRLAGDAIQSGLTLFDSGREKFFLLQVQPPAAVSETAIPPRDYVFIVDVSGSMHGFPLETTKVLLRELVTGLKPTDTFNVMLFSGGSQLLAPASVPASSANVERALRLIDEQAGGGSTELLPALTRALSLSPGPGRSRSFIVVTDGYVSADKTAMDFVRKHLGEANAFAFGIGSSVNRYLIEGIARAGYGEPFIVTKPELAKDAAEKLRKYVRAPVLTNVRVAYDGFDAYDVEPRAVPDVLAARPVVVFGKYRGEARGSITLDGLGGEGSYRQRFEVAASSARPEHRALEYLWARTRIAGLSDFSFQGSDDQRKAAVVELGLRYNLLTEHTSFVAVSRTVRNAGAPATDVKQPLAMPAGVSNLAVGGEGVASAFEPELAWLLALGALLLALAVLRSRREAAGAP